ncbi:hypothetical protein LR48_Vigan03g148900 [Vigna angularis]|uniref:Uncharacterized protein n=1 Tax=Phaseolus angularis TaxID=3914 RepID=A0A0L9U627_PHAAN|nr:uncharacterized protein HKW66_Vig0042600 [Vigna angularis]KOM38107.1 hypothetical protein LR48_Vigan03g148900 [Vigna angularis]
MLLQLKWYLRLKTLFKLRRWVPLKVWFKLRLPSKREIIVPYPCPLRCLPEHITKGDGPFNRVDHVSTSVLGAFLSWHHLMCGNYIRQQGGNFPTPYDNELVKMLGLKGCINYVEVMMDHCMAIIQYFKSYMVGKAQLSAKYGEMEKEKASMGTEGQRR